MLNGIDFTCSNGVVGFLVLLRLSDGGDDGLMAVDYCSDSSLEVPTLLLNFGVIHDGGGVGLVGDDAGQGKVELLVDELIDLLHDLFLACLDEHRREAFVVSLERHVGDESRVVRGLPKIKFSETWFITSEFWWEAARIL